MPPLDVARVGVEGGLLEQQEREGGVETRS